MNNDSVGPSPDRSQATSGNGAGPAQATQGNSQYQHTEPHQQTAPAAPQPARWGNLPPELRERRQWALAGTNKIPMQTDGRPASSTDAATWTSFEAAAEAAHRRGCNIGYMLTDDDDMTCIDLDLKANYTQDDIDRIQRILNKFNSYTERSVSGKGGLHIWVRGKIGRGRRRDGVEIYSLERFVICTGDIVDGPSKKIEERQELLDQLLTEMDGDRGSPEAVSFDDDDGSAHRIVDMARRDEGEFGRLFRTGQWEGKYQSGSEADLYVVGKLALLSRSNAAVWNAFQMSPQGQRLKDGKIKSQRRDYARSTMTQARMRAEKILDGKRLAYEIVDCMPLEGDNGKAKEAVGENEEAATGNGDAHGLLSRLSVDYESDEVVDVPDLVDGLIADEEVTLLGGHGGTGKTFFGLQAGCAIAAGTSVVGKSAIGQRRVLFYSAEDGKKRLIRRLRRIALMTGLDLASLRANLVVVDATELNPLFGQVPKPGAKASTFNMVMGPTADFDALSRMVQSFDPQLLVIDGASDTFDGVEISRRDVRGFMRMIQRVHPSRRIAVLLLAHVNRASAGGRFASDDDGYSGSSQWHNAARRRLFLQRKVEKEGSGDDAFEIETMWLKVMKNQDGPLPPDIELELPDTTGGLLRAIDEPRYGGAQFEGDLALPEQPRKVSRDVDHSDAVLELIEAYYRRGSWISTSLAPNASTGAYASLKGDSGFPKMTKKQLEKVLRDLERSGRLKREEYRRGGGGKGERWLVPRESQ